jgi:group I intron endonuclease
MNSGIYVIENSINNKKYIGSAINIKKRWNKHIYALNKNSHDNSYLQNAWCKYGKINFTFNILEEVEPDKLIEREQYYINLYDVCKRNVGYNLAPTAGSVLGYRHTKETKLKMSIKGKGRKHTEESKKKMSESQKGRKHTEESKKKMSAWQIGRKYSEKAKLNMRKSHKPMSEETRKKLNKYRKGLIISEKTRKKMSESQKGRKHTEETKEKMRKPHGPMSETTKKKISDWRKGLIPSEKTGKMITKKIKNTLLSKENKIKIKKINIGNKYRLGYKTTEKTKEKLRNRIVSEETRKKLSLSCKGKNNGEKNGMSITNKNEVIAIRNDYDNGMTLSQLQTKYNKNYMFIYKIVKRLSWAWLNDSSFS